MSGKVLKPFYIRTTGTFPDTLIYTCMILKQNPLSPKRRCDLILAKSMGSCIGPVDINDIAEAFLVSSAIAMIVCSMS